MVMLEIMEVLGLEIFHLMPIMETKKITLWLVMPMEQTFIRITFLIFP